MRTAARSTAMTDLLDQAPASDKPLESHDYAIEARGLVKRFGETLKKPPASAKGRRGGPAGARRVKPI